MPNGGSKEDQVTPEGAVDLDELALDQAAGGWDLMNGWPKLSSKVSGPAPKITSDPDIET